MVATPGSTKHGATMKDLEALPPTMKGEILSPSTRRLDLTVKRPFYARVGVRFLWYVDLEARLFTVSQLEAGRWVELGVYADDSKARIAPFDDVELTLAAWWANAPAPPGG